MRPMLQTRDDLKNLENLVFVYPKQICKHAYLMSMTCFPLSVLPVILVMVEIEICVLVQCILGDTNT